MRIGLAYNQKPDSDSALDEPPSTSDVFAEWDDPATIDAVAQALGLFGEVVRLEAVASFPQHLARARPDLVFNMAEGLTGVNREAHVPAACEMLGIPYTHSDPLTLAVSLDKGMAKQLVAAGGVPTPRFAVVDGDDTREAAKLACPVIAKPLFEGSSMGVRWSSKIRTSGELAARCRSLRADYGEPVLVEEFLPGAEFTCGVLGNGDQAVVLPIVGMNFGSLPEGALPIYGFEAKWLWDRPESPIDIFDCPARIDDRLEDAIERVTLDAYRALGCRDC